MIISTRPTSHLSPLLDEIWSIQEKSVNWNYFEIFQAKQQKSSSNKGKRWKLYFQNLTKWRIRPRLYLPILWTPLIIPLIWWLYLNPAFWYQHIWVIRFQNMEKPCLLLKYTSNVTKAVDNIIIQSIHQ